MWKEATFQLKGQAPLIHHNGHLADPMCEFALAIKKISGKRKKTEADYEEMGRLEFRGSLYMGENGPILPADCIEATLVNAAKKNREGQLAKAGMFCDLNADLIYDGPTDPDELWENPSHVFRKLVSVQRAKVVRTRPIFPKWEATIVVSFEDTIVSQRQVEEWVNIGGQQVGLLEWRPRYGRYMAKLIGAADKV